jgi:hypothetical protein
VPASLQAPEGLLAGFGGHREHDGLVGAAESLDPLDRVFGQPVDRVLGAEVSGQGQLGVDQVDGSHGGPGDAGVLDGQVTEATDAEDGGQVRGPGPGHLDRLVGGHPGAGERRGVQRVESGGTRPTKAASASAYSA